MVVRPAPGLQRPAGAGIGAGPSGLSAAYHLARLGHEVEIRDAGERPGGMMRYGIRPTGCHATSWTPSLTGSPRWAWVALGHRVEDLDAERREGGFDAAFVGWTPACPSGRHPAKDAGPIVDALRSCAAWPR